MLAITLIKDNNLKKKMRLLLDNCVVNKLVEERSTYMLLSELKEYCETEFFVCYSVVEEILQTPDDKKEKRIQMMDLLLSLEPRILKDSVAVFDKTRFDMSQFNDGDVYERILSLNKTNVRDAIHAQTAVSNGLILVTEDKALYSTMRRFGYKVYNLNDLSNSQTVMESLYPILSQEYASGFVCYFDILGFGRFSIDENNLEQIKKTIVNLQGAKRSNELAKLIGKITIFSDSIFFTVEDEEMREASFINSIISFVCLARDIIQKHIGTDIRAGISYGKYIHLTTGEIYGPSITQAVRLAEPKKTNDPLKTFLEGDPAAIIIHENVFNSPINVDGELQLLIDEKSDRFSKIEGTNYYIVNPYYFIYETKTYGAIIFGKEINKIEVCEEWRRIICANNEFIDKYRISIKALDFFENDSNVD